MKKVQTQITVWIQEPEAGVIIREVGMTSFARLETVRRHGGLISTVLLRHRGLLELALPNIVGFKCEPMDWRKK
jgi:hypothetical protein